MHQGCEGVCALTRARARARRPGCRAPLCPGRGSPRAPAPPSRPPWAVARSRRPVRLPEGGVRGAGAPARRVWRRARARTLARSPAAARLGSDRVQIRVLTASIETSTYTTGYYTSKHNRAGNRGQTEGVRAARAPAGSGGGARVSPHHRAREGGRRDAPLRRPTAPQPAPRPAFEVPWPPRAPLRRARTAPRDARPGHGRVDRPLPRQGAGGAARQGAVLVGA